MRAAIYARVSTFDQEPENQQVELRRYVEARGWASAEFVDRGVSGAKDRRPALDALVRDAKRRRFDVLVCWRLDRLGRNLRHLILLLDELAALGGAFVSLAEGIDATTPAGRLQLPLADWVFRLRPPTVGCPGKPPRNRPPNPLESSATRGCDSAPPCLTNQVFSGTCRLQSQESQKGRNHAKPSGCDDLGVFAFLRVSASCTSGLFLVRQLIGRPETQSR
jgi:hypothetical protein